MATVIFKPTEACNAQCVYCDVVHKESQIKRTMPENILETFFIRINEYLLDYPEENMEIIWHGGEPLLLGPHYFEKALEFQERHCVKTRSRVSHSLQTNLTLLNIDLIKALKKLGIESVGTSYDPSSDLRRLRNKPDAMEYKRRFYDGVALLKKEGMRYGLIYVVTKRSLDRPLDIFYHLTNFCINGAINFNPVLIYGDDLDHLRVTPEEYVNFLGTIFQVWWQNQARYPIVEPFASFVRNLLHKEQRLSCNDSGACAYSHINLAPDGKLSHCGRSSDWGLLDYGTIFDRSFAQVFADPQRQELLRRNELLFDGECKGCRYWPVCHGGCPLDGWAETGSLMRKSNWCRVKIDFIERFFEPITGRSVDL